MMQPNARLTRHLYDRSTRQLVPLSGTFELSPVCNFACKMCYVRKTRKQVAENDRGLFTLEQWLRIAEDARKKGTLFLLLTGGEPFLWPDFWELYERLIQMGFLISINTNGSLIDEAAVEKLRRLPPWRINLTLYGACEETYEALCGVKGVFSRVDRAIMMLRDAGVPVKLNCSLTPSNVQDLEKMIRYAQERELVIDTATYMFPPVRRAPDRIGRNHRFTPEEAAAHRIRVMQLLNSPQRYRAYLERLSQGYVDPPGLDEHCVDPTDGKIRCRAGNASYWITWDGYLTPCGMMTAPKIDLRALGFSESWQRLTEECTHIRLSGACDKCANRSICHPCAAMAQAETGSAAEIPQYLCEIAQAMKHIADRQLQDK
ncbi:MAG: radical SAM protein [Oscillospiraceae bacterium]|nr:radical SAM protein [Oscillospiraceae bacterium]